VQAGDESGDEEGDIVRALKEKYKLKLMAFLYDHNVLGFHRYCWGDLVRYSLDYCDFEDVSECRGPSCNYCRRYCRDPCPRDCKVCKAEMPCGVGEKTFEVKA
jgi:hypothetical protein